MSHIDHMFSDKLDGGCIISSANGDTTFGSVLNGEKVGLWRTNSYDALRSVEYYEQDGQLNKKLTGSLNRTITMINFRQSVAELFGKQWTPKQSAESVIEQKVAAYQNK